MSLRVHSLEGKLSALRRELDDLRPRLAGSLAAATERWLADLAALRFHLGQVPRHGRWPDRPPVVAILGGTGTGKSTLVNRLLGATVSAASFRRTFTSGAVAVAATPANVPEGWLGVPHALAGEGEVPARGRADALIVVPADTELTRALTLVDTPDLDGDQPAHPAQADRVFRWAQAVAFLVTPEKYQMTELLPYYRLARRYALPAWFVMNKCEETAMLGDYARQLAERGWPGAAVFAVPRDDAAWEPPPEANLAALRRAIETVAPAEDGPREAGLARRVGDLVGRLVDQVITPLRQDRAEAERLLANLKAMEAPPPGVDVNPLTQQLQRRLQQRSVLYLMGPARMLERARQVPGLLVRLPRTLWDVVFRGKGPRIDDPAHGAGDGSGVPDFRSAVVDQFAIVQSRLDDLLRSNPAAARWLGEGEATYRAARIDPAEVGRRVDAELGELRAWLENRWNAQPRDTLLLMRLVRYLPGGNRLAKWTEAAPYLLAVVVATHHALFGPVDLAVMGSWSLATWLTEKLSNEVASKTRATNRKIAEDFTAVAHEQIQAIAQWVNEQAPPVEALDKLERLANEISEAVGKSEE